MIWGAWVIESIWKFIHLCCDNQYLFLSLSFSLSLSLSHIVIDLTTCLELDKDRRRNKKIALLSFYRGPCWNVILCSAGDIHTYNMCLCPYFTDYRKLLHIQTYAVRICHLCFIYPRWSWHWTFQYFIGMYCVHLCTCYPIIALWWLCRRDA